MDNLEYHALLRLPPAAARKALGEGAPPETAARLDALDDAEVARLLADLGGHDLDAIVDAFAEADAVTDRPVAILAWTPQGLAAAVRRGSAEPRGPADRGAAGRARRELGVPEGDEWAPFPPDSAEARYIRRVMGEGLGLRGGTRRRRPRRSPIASTCRPGDHVDAGGLRRRPGRSRAQTGLESALVTVSAPTWPPRRTCPGG